MKRTESTSARNDLILLSSDGIFLFFYEKLDKTTVYAMWYEEMEREEVKKIAINYSENYQSKRYHNPRWSYDNDEGYWEEKKESDAEKPSDLDVRDILAWIMDNWSEFSKDIAPYDDTGEHRFFIVDEALIDEYEDFFAKHYPASRKAIDVVIDHLQTWNPQVVHNVRGAHLGRKLGVM